MTRRIHVLGVLFGLLAVPGLASAQIHHAAMAHPAMAHPAMAHPAIVNPALTGHGVNFGPFFRGIANNLTLQSLLPPAGSSVHFAFNPWTGNVVAQASAYNRITNSYFNTTQFANTRLGINAGATTAYNPFIALANPYANVLNNGFTTFNFNLLPRVTFNPYAFNPYATFNPYAFATPYATFNPYANFFNPYATFNPYANFVNPYFNPYNSFYNPFYSPNIYATSPVSFTSSVNPYSVLGY
jgi:hypothetical protein